MEDTSMVFNLMKIPQVLIQKQAVNEIIKCNEYTYGYGLFLTQEQAMGLLETRSYALADNRRIEFGGGIVEKFIKIFCDSPFLSTHNYAETLNELIEIFYHAKNESESYGLIRDDDLIADMKKSFDSICQGSVELLAGREIYNIIRCIEHDYVPDYSQDENSADCGVDEDE